MGKEIPQEAYGYDYVYTYAYAIGWGFPSKAICLFVHVHFIVHSHKSSNSKLRPGPQAMVHRRGISLAFVRSTVPPEPIPDSIS